MKTESDPLLYGSGPSSNSGGLPLYSHGFSPQSNGHQEHSSSNDRRIFEWCYWILIVLQLFSIVIFFLGQTLCIFFYDLTVQMGLQDDIDDIGPALVQVNRSFGVADTVLYLPLLISSVLGLVWKRRKPSLICTAASAGIHSYWSLVAMSIVFLEGRNGDTVTDWNYYVPMSTYAVCCFYFAYGIAVLTFLYVYMDRILAEFR